MKISVIGAGYVGLTTAACLAHIGHEVFCSESDVDKLRKLRSGSIPIFEPHLQEVVCSAKASGRLIFGSTEDAIDRSQVIFICVGTPPLPSGDADLSGIECLARTIAKRSADFRLVVEKSTVPVHTGSRLRKHLSLYKTANVEHEVVSNPEFLREGSAVEDFLHPDRIVVGVESSRAARIIKEVYQPVLDRAFSCPVHPQCQKPEGSPRFLVTDTNSAELIKHASNSFLAMKISFINMVSDLCDAAGADVTKVAEGMGLDPRIGHSFLRPGIGFGGFCFPKDLQAFIRIAEKMGCEFSLLREVEKINQERIGAFVEKIRKELWVLAGKKIAVWGLAFKPNTDDIRYAPSIGVLNALMHEGAVVSAYDPQAAAKTKQVVSGIVFCNDPYEAAANAEAILILTEWDEFRQIDWDRLRSIVDQRLVIDGRNMFDPQEIAARGFRYISVGRPSVLPVASEVNSLLSTTSFADRSGDPRLIEV
jgi:UDPglucose 6-dehydrogenase